eukprot:TRINITY_DN614_c0_g1_i5.p1 TRINITY_DN614_c0_g1~~TRINITY_DN614_c0_g1_i5.p1  ORF type:complete len:215 (+),score=57.53 TRINITY_DN614_c0_g1_i5:47-646(+)
MTRGQLILFIILSYLCFSFAKVLEYTHTGRIIPFNEEACHQTIKIEAWGGSGGGGSYCGAGSAGVGGRGGYVQIQYVYSSPINIYVGGAGQNPRTCGAGGGGGQATYIITSDGQYLLIAGGGGGGAGSGCSNGFGGNGERGGEAVSNNCCTNIDVTRHGISLETNDYPNEFSLANYGGPSCNISGGGGGSGFFAQLIIF